MTNDYSQYIGVGHNNSPEITLLAETQLKLQEKVEKLEEDLKKAKENLREYSEKLLPEKMEELGFTEFTTSSGISVQVKEVIRASLSVENRPKGHRWLEENGFGGIIKSTVIVPYNRDEIQQANALVEELKLRQRLAGLERKVEPMTLVAFIKEQLAQGKDIPLDIFGVLRQRVAKIEAE